MFQAARRALNPTSARGISRTALDRVLIGALCAAGAVVACSSDDSHGGSGNGDGSNDPDVTPVLFPMSTPPLYGYALEDAFPGTRLSGVMDLAWPAGSDTPFALDRDGAIVRVKGADPDVVLDFTSKVAFRAEAGALGMALHPKFADPTDRQPYIYVWYNAEGSPTHQRLSRFTWDLDAQVFQPDSELVLVEQEEKSPEHNAGRVRFGPDGFLYFGNGDDTRESETAQRLDGGLFSGIFRIDVDSRGGSVSHAPPRQPESATTQNYFIPNDNPFVGVANANEEYWALGFRNPYGISFDRKTGDLWAGEIGDTFREEIDPIVKGGNYSWPFLEGTRPRQSGQSSIGTAQPPAFEYPHWAIADLSSIMGGYIYRGSALPELAGKFVFSDWPVGRVWAFDPAAKTRSSLIESYVANLESGPVGFAEDAAGEVYLLTWSKVFRLVRAAAPHGVPTKLSSTGLFRNVAKLTPSSALRPYAIRSPLWSDGAAKQRWVYVPKDKTAAIAANGTVTFPPGSMLVKHFELPEGAKPTGERTKRLETRVLVVGDDTTYGVSYRWNAKGTDADLVLEGIDESIGDANPAEARTWHFPSTGECWSCHRSENRVLGFRGEQLNFPLEGGQDQLPSLVAKGVFAPDAVSAAPAAIASPADTKADLEARATAYLAANCSPCHHPGASYQGGEETWNALPGVDAAKRGLLDAPHHNDPMADALGLHDAPLIAPGDASRSILLQRMKTTDRDLAMPPVGRTRTDPVGVSVVEEWINSLAK